MIFVPPERRPISLLGLRTLMGSFPFRTSRQHWSTKQSSVPSTPFSQHDPHPRYWMDVCLYSLSIGCDLLCSISRGWRTSIAILATYPLSLVYLFILSSTYSRPFLLFPNILFWGLEGGSVFSRMYEWRDLRSKKDSAILIIWILYSPFVW